MPLRWFHVDSFRLEKKAFGGGVQEKVDPATFLAALAGASVIIRQARLNKFDVAPLAVIPFSTEEAAQAWLAEHAVK